MKRLTTIMLTLLVVFLPAMNSYANYDSNGLVYDNYISLNETGGYCFCENSSTDSIGVVETEFDGIYAASPDEYYMLMDESNLIRVEKTDLNLTSIEEVTREMQTLNIDEETQQDILTTTREQNALGNYEATVSVFSEYIPKGRTTTTNEYTATKDGVTYYMKSKLVSYVNLVTDWTTVGKNSSALQLGAACTSLSFECLGKVGTVLSIFANRADLISGFCQYYGLTKTQITGNPPSDYDSIQLKIYYNTNKKTTYVKETGIYFVKLFTYQCKINSVKWWQKYLVGSTGKEHQFSTNVNQTFSSTHYAKENDYVLTYCKNQEEPVDELVSRVKLTVSGKNASGNTVTKQVLFYPAF